MTNVAQFEKPVRCERFNHIAEELSDLTIQRSLYQDDISLNAKPGIDCHSNYKAF